MKNTMEQKERQVVPTAEEFIEKENFPDYVSGGTLNYALKEFARLHVKAALRAAAENATMSGRRYFSKTDRVEAIVSDTCYWEGHPEDQPIPDLELNIDKNSILNAYPDNLII